MNAYKCLYCKVTVKRYASTVRNKDAVYCSKICFHKSLAIKLKGKNNPNYRKGNWIDESKCECGGLKDCRAKKCSICSGKSYMRNGMVKIQDNELKDLIKCSDSILELSKKVAVSRSYISKFIKKHNLDISHMTPCALRPSKKDDVFKIGNKRISHSILKRIIFAENLIDYECEQCELGPEWNNKELILQLDHINGQSGDNRLENLRFLCPNCHTQQDTSYGKNTKRIKKL